MLFKKNFTQQTVNGVQFCNGTLAFQGIQLNVHCFAVDGVLIDTGAKSLEKLFQSFFKKVDIEKVVITHSHEDHTGGAAFLQNELKLPVFMSGVSIGVCKKKADYPMYRKLFWGKREPFHANPIGNTFKSRNATWNVIQTPGHSSDHLVFLNRDTGQLFTGDLFCQERTKVILREENISEIIESLNRVLTFDFGDVFCCHAGYLNEGRRALQRKLEYLLELQDKVKKLYDDGVPPTTITKTLFPKRYPITYFSSGEWNSSHIVHSIIQESKTISR
jgi:glyoxylase-like metal-dependent hydrolase (beta-lactamase superfamily II)